MAQPAISVDRDIAIITVQYRNPADTARLVESLRLLDGAESCELIVVDNPGPSGTPVGMGEAVATRFPVHYLPAEKNLYYWGGAQFALTSIVSGSRSLPKWVIICNNDITIDDRDFLIKLAEIDGNAHPVIGPRIISAETQRDQNPLLLTEPGLLAKLRWRVYDLAYPVAKVMLALRHMLARRADAIPAPSAIETKQRIYAPHGSFLILSSDFFDRGGTLDTTVPLFAEELTIAETARSLGLPIWHLPSLRVTHREHSTTGATLTRAKYQMERMARRRFYDLRRGQP